MHIYEFLFVTITMLYIVIKSIDEQNLPNNAWNNRDLKIRITRSIAIRNARSCGPPNRE